MPKIVVVGSLNMDVVVEVSAKPEMGETVLGKSAHFLPGGKGANQAVAAARLGSNTSMIGAVGNDAFGHELCLAMKQNGINGEAIKELEHVSTGIASILLAEGDNSIIVVPGANSSCLPADIEQHEQVIKEADVVLLQLEIPLETVYFTAEVAKRSGTTVIVNPAPAQSLPQELLFHSDYLTPNRSELAALAQMPDVATETQDQERILLAMRKLQDQGASNIIVTLGAEGAMILGRNGETAHVAGLEMEVEDTTGAGDCFNGALAYALAKKQPLVKAVQFAVAASALSVTKLGAQGGMPILEEVEQLI